MAKVPESATDPCACDELLQDKLCSSNDRKAKKLLQDIPHVNQNVQYGNDLPNLHTAMAAYSDSGSWPVDNVVLQKPHENLFLLPGSPKVRHWNPAQTAFGHHCNDGLYYRISINRKAPGSRTQWQKGCLQCGHMCSAA